MKYTYVSVALAVLGLALAIGGYYFVTQSVHTSNNGDMQGKVPEGYHRMPDGSLMKSAPTDNEDMN